MKKDNKLSKGEICTADKQLEEQYNYMMYDGKYDNQTKCSAELGLVGGNNVSNYCGNIVDLESQLRGYSRIPYMIDSDNLLNPAKNKSNNNFVKNNNIDLDKKIKVVNLPQCSKHILGNEGF